jgi:hypothetical protein
MTLTLERNNPSLVIAEKIEAFDVVAGAWVQLALNEVPATDDLSVTNIANPGRYVAGDGRILVRVTYGRTAPVTVRLPNMRVDYARMKVEP